MDRRQRPDNLPILKIDLDPVELAQLGDLPEDDSGDPPPVTRQQGPFRSIFFRRGQQQHPAGRNGQRSLCADLLPRRRSNRQWIDFTS